MKWYEQLSPGLKAILITYGQFLENSVPGRQQMYLSVDSNPPATWREVHAARQPWVAMAYLRMREELGLAELPPKE
jgi:hypothetical protein